MRQSHPIKFSWNTIEEKVKTQPSMNFYLGPGYPCVS